MTTKYLAALTLLLFFCSVGVYFSEHSRQIGSIAGTELIVGLNPDRVAKIEIHFNKEKKLVFDREDEAFFVSTHKSYPASSSRINDLIYKVASLKIKEKVKDKVVGSALKKFNLAQDNFKYRIAFFDETGRSLTELRVGKKAHRRGHFVMKMNDDAVYLTEDNLWFNNTYKDFVERTVLSLNKDQFEDASSSKALDIRFNEVYGPQENSVVGLNFEKNLSFETKSGITYSLAVANKNNKYYIKTRALTNTLPKQVTIGPDTSQQELVKIGDDIKANEIASQYNQKHGGWVYEVSEEDYKKLVN